MVFMTSLMGWDLAGSPVLSLWDFIPSLRLQGRFLKMWTLLCPSVFLWGLPDYINKSLPSLLHPGAHRMSWTFPVLLLPWFAEEEEAAAQCAHTITVPGGSTHRELALPKEGMVRGHKAQSQISANPRRTGIKFNPVHSTLQHCHRSATPSQILSTLQRTNNQITLTISFSTADY